HSNRTSRVSKRSPVAEFRVTFAVITPTKLTGAPTNVLSRSATGTSQLPDPSAVPNDSLLPSANPPTVTVSPPEPSATEMPSGSGSVVVLFCFGTEQGAAEPNVFFCQKLKNNNGIPIIPITAAMTLAGVLTNVSLITGNGRRPTAGNVDVRCCCPS